MTVFSRLTLCTIAILWSHLLLAASWPEPEDYQCANGQRISIVRASADTEAVQVLINGQPSPLAQVPIADGEMFRDASMAFRLRSGEAQLSLLNGELHHCVAVTETGRATSSNFIAIRGQVRIPNQLPTGRAVLKLKVVRLNRTGQVSMTLAEQEVPITDMQGAVPLETLVDRSLVPRGSRLSVAASIEVRQKTAFRNNLKTDAFSPDDADQPRTIVLKPTNTR